MATPLICGVVALARARRRALQGSQRRRRHPRGRGDRDRVHPHGDQPRRQRPPARERARPVADRRPDRARQPPRAAARPRAPVLAQKRQDGVRDLRPERVQALQRHLRPPERRRAARAARRPARGRRGAVGRGIPARRGRVLPARSAPTGARSASVVEAGLLALSEEGEGFAIDAEYGSVILPDEAGDATTRSGAPTSASTSGSTAAATTKASPREVLLRVLEEREPGLRQHMRFVAELASAVGVRLGLQGQALEQLRLAAELHDIGKLAIPVDVLQKPGVLTEQEWSFIRAAHRGRRARARGHTLDARGRRSSSARRTSAGTAAATPMGSPETRSRYPRGSSPSATPTPR